jgi:hypothetical protein
MGKIISVETVLGMGVGGTKNLGGGAFKYKYLIYCKNFCKCHNVPLHSTTVKKGIKSK